MDSSGDAGRVERAVLPNGLMTGAASGRRSSVLLCAVQVKLLYARYVDDRQDRPWYCRLVSASALIHRLPDSHALDL